MVDAIRSVITKRVNTASSRLLPLYSGVEPQLWEGYLQQDKSIRELWPAQILLGESGIFKGTSGVVQMPTSAGKTRSCELIIRSTFLAKRTKLAIIVAPFRSLCQEIFNDLTLQFKYDANIVIDIVSDVLQNDLDDSKENSQRVLVLTPEKLNYILKQNRDLSNEVGLVIYDEGHLFDDETRGVKYELLLASLKRQLSKNTQTVLISAVISNSQQIKEWLIGDNGVTVEARNLNPTSRNLAFSSWSTLMGQLIFTNENNIDETLFFVPRILISEELQLKKGERKARSFPNKESAKLYVANDVAGYIGCKLSSEGLAAIFTGRKDSALNIAKALIEAFERGFTMAKPIEHIDDRDEVEKMIRYVERLLGTDSIQARSARLGILIHHGSTPQGLRLSIECALRSLQFKCVICTSTLAQGVNLPIKYLIIASDQQGKSKIKVRDFHNLMGRVGRAGKYTEGTVIFSNPVIYDGKDSRRERWRWQSTKKLVNNQNSEECSSRLLSLFEDPPEDPEELESYKHNQKNIIDEISSYLLDAIADIPETTILEEAISDLVKNTFGYFQASEVQKAYLTELFQTIGQDILVREPSPDRRRLFAKSVLPLKESEELLSYLQDNFDSITGSFSLSDTLSALWEVIFKYSDSRLMTRLGKDASLDICKMWINGSSYSDIHEHVSSLHLNNKPKDKSIDAVVDLCETGFSFSCSMIVGSITELINLLEKSDTETQINKLRSLQRSLKYGLPEDIQIKIYDMAFPDRALCVEIAERMQATSGSIESKKEISNHIKNDSALRERISNDYPAYFKERLLDIISP
jgi:superfamily II DNA/RNA helicase